MRLSDGPILRLNDVHPAIHQACARLFTNRHYEQAVFDACKALQELIRVKSGCHDRDGADLVAKVLADSDPVLLVADLSSETGRNIQAGVRFLGMGVMRALRNPSAHEFQSIGRVEALEMIAAVSLVARRVEAAQLATRPAPGDQAGSLALKGASPAGSSVQRSGRASVGIFYQRKFPMYWAEKRWHRIGVHNGGDNPATNVEVKLEKIEPVNPLLVNVLPSRLGRKGGRTDECTINPGDDDYFDVLEEIPLEGEEGSLVIVSQRGPRSLALWTVESAGQIFELDPEVEYRWTIYVSAGNAAPDRRTLRGTCTQRARKCWS